jgi:hypothetical protein
MHAALYLSSTEGRLHPSSAGLRELLLKQGRMKEYHVVEEDSLTSIEDPG